MPSQQRQRHQHRLAPRQSSSNGVVGLTSSILELPKVGSIIAGKFEKLGIRTVRDLLLHWPRAWLDLTQPIPIRDVVRDQVAVLEGKLANLQFEPQIGKRRARVTALIVDDEGREIAVVWHNQSFLRRMLSNGQRFIFIGTVGWNWQERCLCMSNPQRATDRTIRTIYPETEGLSSAFISTLLRPLLASPTLPDPFLLSVNDDKRMFPLNDALRDFHAPERIEQTIRARRRLALDELVALQYQLLERRNLVEQVLAPAIPPAVDRLKELVGDLPFKLTDEQRQAGWEIIQKLNTTIPLRHILQGDVGTGKTVVGLLAGLSVLESGRHVCWMAPTQLLARQLRDRLQQLVGGLPFRVALVTGTEKPEQSTEPTLYIGTQALLGYFDSANMPSLVIVDEQHRFGVEQQHALLEIGTHLLTMTATPIPRALLLAMYGDQSFSQLRSRPMQVQPTTTSILANSQRDEVFRVMQAAICRGEQIFVVTPRIESRQDETGSFPSLLAVAELYQNALPGVRIAAYHGQLKDDQQQTIMEQFLAGEIQILVATSIIEVGLDVPNATVIVIEQAEWFGLAQLHQLRGRVGRGEKPGSCFVFSDGKEGVVSERLIAFASSSDGFKLAEMDLKIRGPGNLLGELQSGWTQLRLADATDTVLVQEARELARALWRQRPPELGAWLSLYKKGEDEGAQA